MPNDEQEANCVIGACCGTPGKRQKALAGWLIRKAGLTGADAQRTADALIEGWDFAPKGKLLPLIDAVADLARGNPYE